MRLFLYGSLLDPAVLARRSGTAAQPVFAAPAWLAGWRRVAMRGGQWPTLAPARGGGVAGMVVSASAAARARLQAYEGAAYRLVTLRVRIRGRSATAQVWISPARTTRPWPAPNAVTNACAKAP